MGYSVGTSQIFIRIHIAINFPLRTAFAASQRLIGCVITFICLYEVLNCLSDFVADPMFIQKCISYYLSIFVVSTASLIVFSNFVRLWSEWKQGTNSILFIFLYLNYILILILILIHIRELVHIKSIQIDHMEFQGWWTS